MAHQPQRIGFIHLVPFTRDDPATGLRDAIELFRVAEDLGLDVGAVRTRHMQYGLSSPAVLLGAIATATERIGLGTAVIPVGHENPFRLAEDLATVDVLSGSRLEPGLSVHPPGYDAAVNDIVYDDGWRSEHYGYGRIKRLRSLLAGDPVREIGSYAGFGGDIDSERVEPFASGLAARLWYGGGSLKSAQWAGDEGLNWLVSNITSSDNGVTEFAAAQRAQIDTFRAAANDEGRVAVARVIVPTDGASEDQRRKYSEYVAARTPRTKQVVGRNTLIAMDLLGSTEQIVEEINNDAAFAAADDYLFELPFEFEQADWVCILEQIATRIGPALGWSPRG